MILDTSAIVAAIAVEPDGPRYRDAMIGAASVAISSVAVLETRIVLHSRLGVEQVAFEAFRRYGKGQGHPAQLNLVDCAAYALAKLQGEPLLFKGGDFEKTDIQSAL